VKIVEIRFEAGTKPEEAIAVMKLAEKVSALLNDSHTTTALNAMVFVIAEFIAQQEEEIRAEAIRVVAKSIEENIPFFLEAQERFKAWEAEQSA
jgi:hypothetical protein